MKKALVGIALLALVFVGFPSMSQAQILDPNIEVVAGVNYLVSDPGLGLNRVHFLFSANTPGIKVVDLFGQPLYLGGVGFDLRTVDQAIGQVAGFGLTVPALTYHFGGGPVVLQVGYVRDITGTEKTDGFYAGVGFGATTPKAIKAKRAAKKAAKKAELGPPAPDSL